MNAVVRRKNEVFYIRKRIPAKIRKILGLTQTEFNKSLDTSDYATAVRRAAPLLRQLEISFEQLTTQIHLTTLRHLMKKKDEDFVKFEVPDTLLKIDKIRALPDGSLEIEGLDLDSNNLEAENAAFSQIVATVQKRDCSPRKTAPTNGAMLLSELIDKHVHDKFASGDWTEFEAPGIEKKLRRFLEVVGDRPIIDYNVDDAAKFRKFVTQLPPRAEKFTVEEILSGNIKERISPATCNNWFVYTSALFNWAIKKNVDGIRHNPFAGLMLTKRRADTQRRATTDHELRAILEHLNSLDDLRGSRLWGYRIGAHSGLRAGEICQLRTSDIQEIGGIWCFSINEEEGKKVKTENGVRIVPIHSKLLKAGFMEFVKKIDKNKRPRKLFPECIPVAGKAAHGFSKWCGLLKKELIETGKLSEDSASMTFHGLRHAIATKLRDADVSESRVAELLGHERGLTLSFTRYAKTGNVEKLREAIEKVSWE
jgi:integrase